MNLLLEALMDKPSIPRGPRCPICGATWPPVTEHHIVPRSQNPGWKTNPGPTLYPCGHGTAGCHGKFEVKLLHARFNDEAGVWEILETERPTKYEKALAMDGWLTLEQLQLRHLEVPPFF